MKKDLRTKCPNCGHWNRIPVNKIFIEQLSLELDQQHKRTEKLMNEI